MNVLPFSLRAEVETADHFPENYCEKFRPMCQSCRKNGVLIMHASTTCFQVASGSLNTVANPAPVLRLPASAIIKPTVARCCTLPLGCAPRLRPTSQGEALPLFLRSNPQVKRASRALTVFQQSFVFSLAMIHIFNSA